LMRFSNLKKFMKYLEEDLRSIKKIVKKEKWRQKSWKFLKIKKLILS
jgi:hypothetical protein